jgi:hypothetical protein
VLAVLTTFFKEITMKRTLTLALAMTIMFCVSLQAVTVELTNGDLATKADQIVVGTVTSLKSEWNEKRTSIHTLITIKVDKYVKGAGANEITVTIEGGEVGGIGQKTSDTPVFTLGEEVVVFTNKDGRLVGAWQGKFNVIQSGGQKCVVRNSGGAVAKPGAGVAESKATAATPLASFIDEIQKNLKK